MSALNVNLHTSIMPTLGLDLTPSDKVIAVRENQEADSNFILTYIIKHAFHEKNRVLLVCLHQPLEHYQKIGKILGYDLAKECTEGNAAILLSHNTDTLLVEIQSKLRELSSENQKIYVIIDDVSHLLDLGVDVGKAVRFLSECLNLNEDVCYVVNTHVSNDVDLIIANALEYVADVKVEVSPLETGRSVDVTGIVDVTNMNRGSTTRNLYKAYDRGIKTFKPGQWLHKSGIV